MENQEVYIAGAYLLVADELDKGWIQAYHKETNWQFRMYVGSLPESSLIENTLDAIRAISVLTYNNRENTERLVDLANEIATEAINKPLTEESGKDIDEVKAKCVYMEAMEADGKEFVEKAEEFIKLAK